MRYLIFTSQNQHHNAVVSSSISIKQRIFLGRYALRAPESNKAKRSNAADSLMRILGVILILVFVSCDDYLEVKPKGTIIPESIEDYRLLLDNTSGLGMLSTYDHTFISSDDVVLPELFAHPSGYFYQEHINAYCWGKKIYTDSQEDDNYRTLYHQIYICNTIIKGIAAAKGEESQKEIILAEAKFQRAFAHFILVNLYGKHYNPVTANTDLGVKIKTNILLTESLERNTVQEVYDFVIKELNDVIKTKLPEVPEVNHRASMAACYALLARIYQYQNDFKQSLKYINQALSRYNKLMDFSDGLSDYPSIFDNPEILLNKTTLVSGVQVIFASKDLTNLFDSNNERIKLLYGEDSFFDTGELLYSELLKKSDFYPVGITVPEMYLIKAEANARLGDYNSAMKELNLLRKTRISSASYEELKASDATEALSLVKKERRTELAFRGLRWFDIKRYNVFDEANISLSRTLDGKEYKLEANSGRWALPIAEKYILMNNEIIQNP